MRSGRDHASQGTVRKRCREPKAVEQRRHIALYVRQKATPNTTTATAGMSDGSASHMAAAPKSGHSYQSSDVSPIMR